jgi:membrane-associated phospholipid phosphatase
MGLWPWIALAYFGYLAVLSWAGRRFRRARWPTSIVMAVFAALMWMFPSARPSAVVEALLPLPVLLIGYWLSGLFFVRPMDRVEQWLLRVDAPFLMRMRRCPALVREYLELTYVLVYAVVPAGALTLALGGHADAVPRFWAVVLLAEFASYGMLPWLQTRPPRALETCGVDAPSLLRRFNLAILGRGSIQVNTVPSGHAAGAAAVALAVLGAMPIAGGIFLALAVSIVIATVFGRYHYVIDSLLGVLVAVAAWSLIAPG